MNTDPPDLIAFRDDEPGTTPLTEPWLILIVDDDEDVHLATRLALQGLTIEDKSCRFLHAHTGSAACKIIADEPRIAVVLLDVVMETEDAGLQVARYVRQVLRRSDVRIILRTGQPGYAPEVDTIRQYDINDYKTKSELTRTRLYTSLTVAVRSYSQIQQSERFRQGLETIIASSGQFGRLQGARQFAQGIVTQLCSLLGLPDDGLVCAGSTVEGRHAEIIAAAGRFAHTIGAPLASLSDNRVVAQLEKTLRQRASQMEEGTCLFLPVDDTPGIAVYLDSQHPIDSVNRRLVEVFSSNITVGFGNALLHERIASLAYRDPLLGLPNRNSVVDWVERESSPGTVLALVDLDGFSDINSVLDPGFGDDVLRAVGDRLVRHFRPPARVARMGSDLFAVLGNDGQVDAEQIEQAFLEPMSVREQMLRLSATSGLLRLGDRPISGLDALRSCSVALKRAKEMARGKAVYFDDAQWERARERMFLLNDLRTAFSMERLFVVYQPFVSLRSGEVVGAEALLRWRTPSGEFVPPDRFIPLAEESGLMVPLGEWVIREALRDLRSVMDTGRGDFRMAINVSYMQFREPDFVAKLRASIQHCSVPAANVELELTESVAIENLDMIVERLQSLNREGVSLALDDFGTGYSSLSVMKRLPIDRLKIDRSFVRTVDQDDSIASLIISLSRNMKLSTIAEGIETVAQRDRLKAMGCEEGQGYLYSRPLLAKDLLSLLGSWTPAATL